MAENKQPWDAVFDRVRVDGNPTDKYARRQTKAELDHVEATIGSRLPQSYRVFMTRFGPGELYGEVQFYSVTPIEKGETSIAERTLEMREVCKQPLHRTEKSDWLSSLVYFADSYSGEFAWDPADITSSSPHECRIYRLPRMFEHYPEDGGTSFAEFTEWIVARARTWHDPQSVYEMGRGIRFDPFINQRPDSRPAASDVALWLAWNNHTVRDLARSIRDRGQTDAYPILADALQEAGCTNADLLDSCRTGDPDIDGVWALRVLLCNE